MKALRLAPLLLLLPLSARARPLHPVKWTKSVAHQYVQMAKDCTRTSFIYQCVAVAGAIAFDGYSTVSAVHTGFVEKNPLVYGVIGRRPTALKLSLFDVAYASSTLTASDALYNKHLKTRWDLGITATTAFSGMVSGLSNSFLVSDCHAKIYCPK